MNFLKKEINYKRINRKQFLHFSKHFTLIILFLTVALINGFGQQDCEGNQFENVNCHYQNEEIKSAVVRLTSYFTSTSGYRECTGTLINNTSEDKTPYIITARHCACGLDIGVSSPNSFIKFDYEEDCDGQALDYTTLYGLTLLAYDDNADVALLQISEPIPSSLDTYFVGWDRSFDLPERSYSIHHPDISGPDYKKYQKDDDPAILYDGTAEIDNTGCGEYTLQDVNFFEVDFNLGTSKSGSSGAPLFNQSDKLVGALYGRAVSNSCAKHYGRIRDAWSVLSPFLCPTGDCPTKMTGLSSSDSNNFDIFLSNQFVSNTNLSEGDNLTISCIHNVANAAVNQLSPNPDVKFYVSNDLIVDASDKYLGRESSSIGISDPNDFEDRNVTVTNSWGCGTKYILFVADANQEHGESNENNNLEYVQINIDCGDGPDLIIEEVTSSKTTTCPYEYVYTTTKVKNIGDYISTINTRLKYYLSTNDTYEPNTDVFLARDYVNDLEPSEVGNETAWLRSPANTLPGNYYLLFVADETDICAESNENNNVGSVPVTIVSCRLANPANAGGSKYKQLNGLNFTASPNHFDEFTQLSYTLEEKGPVTITLYDMAGKKIEQLLNKQMQEAGPQTVQLKATDNMSNGLYLCHINTEKMQQSIKIIINK